ncbi:MAG: acyl carrier protein [Oscillospiraceae bacterium]|jgi:acyl carrier protein|nr:acyl carrier protein [Oscillospiraceae bacterium]
MDIKAKLQEVFRDVFDDGDIELRDNMTAADIEDWDSLAHIQLIVAAEKAFGVKFFTAEVSRLKNVGDFIALIENKL